MVRFVPAGSMPVMRKHRIHGNSGGGELQKQAYHETAQTDMREGGGRKRKRYSLSQDPPRLKRENKTVRNDENASIQCRTKPQTGSEKCECKEPKTTNERGLQQNGRQNKDEGVQFTYAKIMRARCKRHAPSRRSPHERVPANVDTRYDGDEAPQPQRPACRKWCLAQPTTATEVTAANSAGTRAVLRSSVSAALRKH